MKRKNILLNLVAGAFCILLAASCNENGNNATEHGTDNATENHSTSGTENGTTDGTTSSIGTNETNSTGSTGKSMDASTAGSGMTDSMPTNGSTSGAGHTTR